LIEILTCEAAIRGIGNEQFIQSKRLIGKIGKLYTFDSLSDI